jgi:hypothetical protein
MRPIAGSGASPMVPKNGEHEPIVDHALFEAVQTKLTASAAARQLRLKGSPAILAGRIFDNRGNRMTPTHTNKRGARDRYYVSHVLLQRRNDQPRSRVSVNPGWFRWPFTRAKKEGRLARFRTIQI